MDLISTKILNGGEVAGDREELRTEQCGGCGEGLCREIRRLSKLNSPKRGSLQNIVLYLINVFKLLDFHSVVNVPFEQESVPFLVPTIKIKMYL